MYSNRFETRREPVGIAVLSVEIVEVSPRDGIQNEGKLLTTDAKAALIEKASRRRAAHRGHQFRQSGARPANVRFGRAWPPRCRAATSVVHIGLVLNRKGFKRARAAGIDEINMVVVASDTFSRRNQGVGTFETVAAWGEIAQAARGTMSSRRHHRRGLRLPVRGRGSACAVAGRSLRRRPRRSARDRARRHDRGGRPARRGDAGRRGAGAIP